MTRSVLVTGGAGFIGRHVAAALARAGMRVRVLDSFVEQVHGAAPRRDHLSADVEIREGDVRDGQAVRAALAGIDAVVHLAAEVGVGQSMYAIEHYTDVNERGSAVLFEALAERPVERVVVASSMSIYGEGLYRDADGAIVDSAERGQAPRPGAWDPVDASGRALTPVPTPEWKQPALVSVYAINKFVQERLTLTVAPAYGMEAVALRLFNVYGPGQALSNPYTGVLAIFASRLLNGRPPLVFEDGEQRRDFVHVEDVARAFVAALESPGAAGQVFNIGSGRDVSVLEVATELAAAMGRDIAPEVVGKFRRGDVRHCFADTARAAEVLGFRATRDFREGLAELTDWVGWQEAVDRVDEARGELERRGLVA